MQRSFRGISTGIAGLTDAGIAALSGFSVGVVAIVYLDAEPLGVYALGFAAIPLVSTFVYQLLYEPFLAYGSERSADQRMAYTAAALRSTWWLVLLTAFVCFVLYVALLPDHSAILALAIALAATTDPMQMLMRQTRHFAHTSWLAVGGSALRLIVTLGTLGILVALDTDVAGLFWAIFAGSTACTVVLWPRRFGTRPDIPLGEALNRGRSIAAAGIFTVIGFWVASWLVSNLAGLEDLGKAEAARIIAQPIAVVGLGLAAVMRPRVMASASVDDLDRVTRNRRSFYTWFTALSAAYVAVLAAVWLIGGDDMFDRISLTSPLLAAVALGGAFATALAYPAHAELLGRRAERRLVAPAMGGAAAMLVVSLFAASLGAVTRPLAVVVGGLVRFAGFEGAVSRERRETT